MTAERTPSLDPSQPPADTASTAGADRPATAPAPPGSSPDRYELLEESARGLGLGVVSTAPAPPGSSPDRYELLE